jgi:diguanylate cyclase (GGDEF)-like protein/PAS domain S-box-containing protein
MVRHGGSVSVTALVGETGAPDRGKAKFESVLDAAPDAMVGVDELGTIQFVNRQTEAVFGYDRTELIGLPIDMLVPESLRHVHLTHREGYFADPRTRSMGAGLELYGRRRDGTEFPVDIALSAVDTDDGLMVTAAVRDITERKGADQDVRRLAAILEHSAEAILSKTLDGIIVTWNPAAERLYGYTAAEAVGKPVSILVPPGHVNDVTELLARVGRGEQIKDHETARVRKDGRVIDVSVSLAPIRDSRGEIVGASTIARDITEHKRMDDDLRTAVQRYRPAFESAPVGMAQLDLDGRLVQANDALGDLLGYTASQLLGRTSIELTHPDDAARTVDAIAQLAAGELTSFHAEQRYQRADGDPIWVALSIAAVTNNRGQVQHLLAHYLDITDRKRSEAELAHLADHDPLTGLLNRRGFETELDRQAADVTRYGPSGALVMLDLDHFKEVNDTLGHLTGDELIVSIGEVLKRTVRATDIVARLCGDEFAIILPHALRADAQAVADKIVRAVRNQVTVLSGDHPRVVTASAGLAMFDDPGLSGEGVLLNADLALYDAKNAGRNGYAFYNGASPKHPPTKTRLDWVERINVALEQDLFELHAQPVLDLRTGRVSRYELLLRMLDDDGHVIGPDAFLHTAERTGLIGRIDRWVTGQAIGLLAHPNLPQDTILEVNISGLSVGDADLLTFLEERFTETGADPSRLVFEITETAAVSNVQAARTFAERLTDIGCQFALDDFGSGFGSFYYLKHLLFDYIKIDGEFIANCITSQTDQLVIQALVTIAHGMNKQTVAEYVGDEDTLRFVTNEGIDFAQGYHIGKPDAIDGLISGQGRDSSPDRVHT